MTVYQVDKCKHFLCIVKSTARNKNSFTYSISINNIATVKNVMGIIRRDLWELKIELVPENIILDLRFKEVTVS